MNKVCRADHKDLQGKSIEEIARLQGKSAIDAMLDLSLDEELDTVFEDSITQGDEKAVAAIFRSPYVMLGQSDAGAHAIFAPFVCSPPTSPAPIRDSVLRLFCSVIGCGSGGSCPWRKPLEN